MLIDERKTRRPSFQFYPNDWLSDQNLQACSFEAQGLWINLMCLMHNGRPYGYLTDTQGNAINEDLIRRILRGIDRRTFRRLLAELGAMSVVSYDEVGLMFSRRMTRDEHKRLKQSDFGKTGGNPSLKAPPKKSASSSSSSSSSRLTPIVPKGDERFETFWKAYPRKVGKGAAEKSWSKIKGIDEVMPRIMSGIQVQLRSFDWKKDNGQFIPHPATWLNQRRWEDVVVQVGVPAHDPEKMEAKNRELEQVREREWAKRLKMGQATTGQQPPWPPPFALPALKNAKTELGGMDSKIEP